MRQCGRFELEIAGTDLKSQVRAQRHLDRPLHLKHRKCTHSKEGCIFSRCAGIQFQADWRTRRQRVHSTCTDVDGPSYTSERSDRIALSVASFTSLCESMCAKQRVRDSGAMDPSRRSRGWGCAGRGSRGSGQHTFSSPARWTSTIYHQ